MFMLGKRTCHSKLLLSTSQKYHHRCSVAPSTSSISHMSRATYSHIQQLLGCLLSLNTSCSWYLVVYMPIWKYRPHSTDIQRYRSTLSLSFVTSFSYLKSSIVCWNAWFHNTFSMHYRCFATNDHNYRQLFDDLR